MVYSICEVNRVRVSFGDGTDYYLPIEDAEDLHDQLTMSIGDYYDRPGHYRGDEQEGDSE